MASGGFIGGYREYIIELSDGQQLLRVVDGVDENHFATTAAELGEERNEYADAGTVDVPSFGKVNGALVQFFAQMRINGLQELVGIGATNQVTGEADEEDAVFNGAGDGHAGEVRAAA